ncbi:cytochrome P450 [Penicillium concentricum]|uniref:Cytochrome P450 n=1 Tax=Penicillium concentricum TaxID=293559 RepID=A0A9W9S9D1_9EURO|nr:cytochrome P450 [Penicillium concentricum]KAJ5374388.1 cytochrome P450 [Penicillium concentricum]
MVVPYILEIERLRPISLSILVSLLLTYAIRQWLLPRPIPGIPYNLKSSRKLLGDAPDMLREVSITRDSNAWLAQQVNKLQSPLCQVFMRPFSRPWVLLADATEAQDILLRRPEFDRSEIITDGLGPLGAFHARMKTGPMWKAARAWLKDLMGPSFLNNIVSPVMYESSVHLMELWESKVRLASGRPFDVNNDLTHSAVDGMLSFVFERHFEHTAVGPQIEILSHLDPSKIEVGVHGDAKFPAAPVNEFITSLYETVDVIDTVAKSIAPRAMMWWIRQFPRYKKIAAVRIRVVREQVMGALERLSITGETKTAIEYMLVRMKKIAEEQNCKPDYESPVFVEEIEGMFIAGTHSVSTTIAWALIYLTRYPEIQDKLRLALHTAYADAHAEERAPTIIELTNTRVPYLQAVLEEVLRLHATSVPRQAVRDTEILGQRIPKGTHVILVANGPSFHAPSFDIEPGLRSATVKPNKWDETRDLKAFDPERWLVYKEGMSWHEAEFDANAAPQIAFGMGPRYCWGRRLAYLEMRMVITLVLWSFDLLSLPDALADPKAYYGIIHKPGQCCLRLKSRK